MSLLSDLRESVRCYELLGQTWPRVPISRLREVIDHIAALEEERTPNPHRPWGIPMPGCNCTTKGLIESTWWKCQIHGEMP